MLTYEETIRRGVAQYTDVLDLLASLGLPAQFTQTGGMCAAIEVQLEGALLLVTDAEDALSWVRDEQGGWGVGLYLDPEYANGPVAFESTEDISLTALGALVDRVLRAGRGGAA